jgi:SM-20-related protein
MDEIVSELTEGIYEKGFIVKDGFLSQENLLKLIEYANTLKPTMHQASIGREQQNQINTEIRKDKIVWLEEDIEWFAGLFTPFLEVFTLALNRRCFLGINTREFMLARYDKGDYYKKHRDAFQQNDSRKITIILYLNLNWQKTHGGELMLYTELGEAILVEPVAGRLVVFESVLEHEVLPSNAERVSITGWLKRV